MDFKAQQNSIKKYISDNFKTTLAAGNLPDMDAYIDDYLDLDKYSKAKQLFYFFNYYNYDDLTNESGAEEFEFSIFLVFKNNTVETLRTQMLDYTSAFCNMFRASGENLGGIADYGRIQSVEFFPAAEGHKEVKVAEIIIKLFTETE